MSGNKTFARVYVNLKLSANKKFVWDDRQL